MGYESEIYRAGRANMMRMIFSILSIAIEIEGRFDSEPIIESQ